MSTPINPIKYVLLGDCENSKLIAEFSANASNTAKKQALQIFQRVCKTYNEKNYEGRNKITGQTENFYFKLEQPCTLYLVIADSSYVERFIFKMMEEITEDKIPLMVDETTKELNAQGRQALKGVVEYYQDVKNINKIAAIQSDVDSVKSDLQKNIAKQMENMEDVKDLESKSSTLKFNANEYKKNSDELRTITFWQNFKLWIILAVVIIILVLVIVLPIVL